MNGGQGPKQIFVVDDDESVRWTLKKALEREDYRVLTLSHGAAAVTEAERHRPDLLLLDVKMPGLGGLETLSLLRDRVPGVMVIVMTAFGTLQTAVEAMKRGAYDYITKPFDFEELCLLVRRALEVQTLTREVALLKAALRDRRDFGQIVGASQGMQELFKLIGQVADSDATILVQGESGTGKELVAKAIHAASPRAEGPFVTINCAAIPKDLLESELFGHEKGAFTGAAALRRGKFELAHHGTIFLDEVGEMDPVLQTKILRVLQEQCFERVGSETTIRADVRIIAAANRDLEVAVARQAFREDLFYRLNVVTIRVPPLRDRPEDIPLLIAHFLSRYARGEGWEVSPEAMRVLTGYPWPGNVRELENAIKRACLLARTRLILPEHLPPVLAAGGTGGTIGGEGKGLAHEIRQELRRLGEGADGELYDRMLARLERPLMQATLERVGGNQLQAARILGINRNTLRKKLKALGLLQEARTGLGPPTDPPEAT
ncbi:MAG: sigma-54-dependent transcriptional regulator [Candidatus Methylomirabilales bacterium]